MVGRCLLPFCSLLRGMETMRPFTMSFGMDTTRLPTPDNVGSGDRLSEERLSEEQPEKLAFKAAT